MTAAPSSSPPRSPEAGLRRTLVQVPPGVQCFVGAEARRRRAIEERTLAVFEGWDYEEIIPPLFDYAEVFADAQLAPKVYSFPGRDGSLLALRPDFTSLLAKIAAGRLAARPTPIRLYYSGEILRYDAPRAGRENELYQMGVEHLGGEARAADAEVLAIAAECLTALGAGGWTLVLGHVGVFGALVAAAGLAPPQAALVRARVEAKDRAGTREALDGAGLAEAADAIVELAALAGDREVLDRAGRLLQFCPQALAALRELSGLIDALAGAGLATRLAVDLGQLKGLDYYTGTVFQIYAQGLGSAIGSGGRYDGLLGRFGRPMGAVGFMLGLDRVARLLERQGRETAAEAGSAERVAGPDLGDALLRARARRAAGVRIRFGDGSSR